MRGPVVGAIVMAFVAAGGWAGGGDGAASNTTSGAEAIDTDAGGLTATLQRSTLFETHRSPRLTVRSQGDGREIAGIQLRSPLFEPVRPEARDAPVPPDGGQVVMPLPFGEARCDEDNGGPGNPAELVAEVDGRSVRIPIMERPRNLLSELHDSECAAAAVLAGVDLGLGDTWERTAPHTLEGDIELAQREGGTEAAVEEVKGNVIFTVSTKVTPSRRLVVSDERPSASASIAITASRCDPHALIEYKRTFIFTASVRVDGSEPTTVDVAATGAARRALEDLLTSCLG